MHDIERNNFKYKSDVEVIIFKDLKLLINKNQKVLILAITKEKWYNYQKANNNKGIYY